MEVVEEGGAISKRRGQAVAARAGHAPDGFVGVAEAVEPGGDFKGAVAECMQGGGAGVVAVAPAGPRGVGGLGEGDEGDGPLLMVAHVAPVGDEVARSAMGGTFAGGR